jgi:maleylacetoacetate isomerase
MTIKFYGFWRSIASFRVRVALNLKSLPYEEVSVDILSGNQFTPEYDKLNAGHSVPTVIHDGHTLFQSMAIMEYLDEIQPEPALLPKDPAEKAYIRAVCLATVADTHPLFVPRIRKYLAATYGADAEAVEEWGRHWVDEGFGTFERLLDRRPGAPFIGGKAPGLADICIAGHVVSAGYFKLDYNKYRRVAELGEHCFALPPFSKALPLNQPNAPKSV